MLPEDPRETLWNSWIGFDLDGTLAESGQWGGPEYIGKPVAPMVALAKAYLERGYDVRIMTARVGPHGTHYPDGEPIPIDFSERAEVAIRAWCLEHLGQELPVTATKDFEMLVLYDDRAIQVQKNTGKLIIDAS